MISKRSTVAARKTRTRIRKPKYLSLRLQLISPGNTSPSPPMPTANSGAGLDHSHEQKQQLINLFPLHPENLQEEQNMACIFSSCDGDGAATTLTGLLCSDDEEENMNNPSPSSVNYADEEVELVRTAMRRNKTERDQDHRDDHNEKWVCYSEVVEKKEVIRGLSSSSLTSSSSCNNNRIKVKLDDDDRAQKQSKLVLKLDYEEIMNAWVDKGPLYIHDNPDLDLGVDSSLPQTVPELGDDDFFAATPLNGERSSNAGLWTVPEMAPSITKETSKVNKEIGGEEPSSKAGTMGGQREASVQRYKEKRQNRLFAKTIRYQVRKLNAEKRPRVKGRFVKRS